MGATKGYHPISLHVIRGAAEFCGYKFGKIRRIASMPSDQRAIYVAAIDAGPEGWRDWPVKTLKKQLQHCFMDDIQVKDVKTSYGGPTSVVLEVWVAKSPLDAALEKELEGRK